MRCPSGGRGGNGGSGGPPPRASGRASARSPSTSRCSAAHAPARSRNPSRSLCSPACTSPRCRSGSSRPGALGRQPRTGISATDRAQASRRIAPWRSEPTRLKTTPTTSTPAWKVANPLSTAAAEAAWAPASMTRTTGHPVARERSAVEPRGSPLPTKAPSNSPMTPSQITTSAFRARRQAASAKVSGRMAQESRLRHGLPVAAAWKAGSM